MVAGTDGKEDEASANDDEEGGNPKPTCRYVSIFKVFELQSQSVLILTSYPDAKYCHQTP